MLRVTLVSCHKAISSSSNTSCCTVLLCFATRRTGCYNVTSAQYKRRFKLCERSFSQLVHVYNKHLSLSTVSRSGSRALTAKRTVRERVAAVAAASAPLAPTADAPPTTANPVLS
eukprot:12447-Heterococcus_DN1.PRE.3